jgi:transposase InsO family protein
MVERQIGKMLKVLWSDNGGEYTSNVFNQFCKKIGIIKPFIVPQTPKQNGVVERKNQTLVKCASML